MGKGAIDQVSGLLKSLSGLPGSISRIFSGSAKWLVTAGKNIIIGLWNGVVSLWNWLAAGFRRLTNLIPSWKGPEDRDRKLLTPAGVAIMRGLSAGIASQIPALRSTLAGVTGEINAGVTPAALNPAAMNAAAPAGVSAAAAGGGLKAQITLNVEGGDSQLKTMVKKWVRVDGGGDVQIAFGRT
jgi:phage-related protein